MNGKKNSSSLRINAETYFDGFDIIQTRNSFSVFQHTCSTCNKRDCNCYVTNDKCNGNDDSKVIRNTSNSVVNDLYGLAELFDSSSRNGSIFNEVESTVFRNDNHSNDTNNNSDSHIAQILIITHLLFTQMRKISLLKAEGEVRRL